LTTTKLVDEEPALFLENRQFSQDALLAILADRHCRNIIKTTIDSPKSAKELSYIHGVSLNTTYRRIHALWNKRVLRISGVINDNGKKVFVYQSRIRGINIRFANRSLEIDIVPNNSNMEDQDWKVNY
jgi:hypothetical protein